MDIAAGVATAVATLGWVLLLGAFAVAFSAPVLAWARDRPATPTEVPVGREGRPVI